MTRRGFFKWLGIGGLLAAGGTFAVRRANAGNPYYSGPAASNFDGRTFFNPGGAEPRGFGGLGGLHRAGVFATGKAAHDGDGQGGLQRQHRRRHAHRPRSVLFRISDQFGDVVVGGLGG